MVLGFATATEFPRSAITPLLSAKVLAHYDPSKRILLQCDASNYGLVMVLSHVMEDGTERLVGFASRTLKSVVKNYPLQGGSYSDLCTEEVSQTSVWPVV